MADVMSIHTGWKIVSDLQITETSNHKKKVTFAASAPRPDNSIWMKKFFSAYGYMAEEIEKRFSDGLLKKGISVPSICAKERPYKVTKDITTLSSNGKPEVEQLSYIAFSYDILDISYPLVSSKSDEVKKSPVTSENIDISGEVLSNYASLEKFMEV